jgi:hypothetical protein
LALVSLAEARPSVILRIKGKLSIAAAGAASSAGAAGAADAANAFAAVALAALPLPTVWATFAGFNGFARGELPYLAVRSAIKSSPLPS